MSDEKKRLLTKEDIAEYRRRHDFYECDFEDIDALLDHADAADEEIERLTDIANGAHLACDVQAKEIASLRQQNERLKRVLADCASQIERDAVTIEWEWGACASRDEMIVNGGMPDCYYEAKRLLEKGDA